MKKVMIYLRKLLRGNQGNDQAIHKKEDEAQAIKRNMHDDIERVAKRVSIINKTTTTALHRINVDLRSTTYSIAIATGARERGLR